MTDVGTTSPISTYGQLLRNRPFVLLTTGQTISVAGDMFFNLAIVWVVYTQSASALQTAFIQVIWQFSAVVVGPVAGVLTDRWNRKSIMVVTNLLAGVVVGGVAAVMSAGGPLSPGVVFCSILLLNGLSTFLAPARAAVL